MHKHWQVAVTDRVSRQDKNRRTLFEGPFDGIPRYVACVDIDGDADPDVTMRGVRNLGSLSQMATYRRKF